MGHQSKRPCIRRYYEEVIVEKKVNQRIALTKRLLKESLIRLMAKKGLNKISISELCKDAGINRATFYHHYNTPYDLLDEMGDEMVAAIHRRMEEQLGQQDTLSKRAEIICAYLSENKPLAKLLVQYHSPDSAFAVKLIKIPNYWESTCKSLSADYGESGKNLLVTFIVHGVYSMVRQWLLEDIDKSPQEMGQLVSSIYIRGFME